MTVISEFGWRAEGSGIRINVRAIDPLSVRRQCQVAGAAARQQALGLLPALEVDHGYVAAQAVRDVERRAVAVRDDSARFRSGGQRLHDLQRRRVDHRHGVGPGIGDVELTAIGRQRDAARHAADGNAADDFAGWHIDDAHFVAVLADDVEQAAIRRGDHFERRQIALLRIAADCLAAGLAAIASRATAKMATTFTIRRKLARRCGAAPASTAPPP